MPNTPPERNLDDALALRWLLLEGLGSGSSRGCFCRCCRCRCLHSGNSASKLTWQQLMSNTCNAMY